MPNTYTELARQTLGAATGTVTFSSIPSGYTDLVLVANVTGIGNISAGAISIRFNSDTATNYSATYLMGNGSSATSGRASNDTRMIVASPTLNLGNNPFVNIVQIQNYSNTTTNKTVLSRSNIAATQVAAIVGLYRSTSAITSITYESYNSQTMSIGSTFSLYGIANADQGAAKATGGIITEDANYWYHTFGASGTFTPKQSLTCDVLVVAGGGGGGSYFGGGGGGGGLSYQTGRSVSATTNITVGGGGTATTAITVGGSGSNSVFDTITSNGGGGGGVGNNVSPTTGGSGGGGGGYGFTTGAAATQGNTGGATGYGFAGGNGGTTLFVGGGGGGAGSVGANFTGSGTSTYGGNGGAGFTSLSSWASTTGTGVGGGYAGGGGGGTRVGESLGAGTAVNGGGAGGFAANATNGIANTGGGGGGGGTGFNNNPVYIPGTGGSGIVIVRYAK
jgi:hypothetical protein